MKKLIMLLLILLTGCYDKHEIEEQAFVVVIGLDDSEREDGVTVTYQIANPQAEIANSGGEKEEPSDIITFTAPDFLTARDLANASVSRKINFSHTKVIVIGEEFARKEKALKFLSSGVRDREIRRDIVLMVSKEKASEFINKNDPTLETRPHKFYDLMAGRWEDTGLVPLSNLQKFLQRLESGTDAFLAIYASTEKNESNEKGNEDDYLPGQINQQGGNVTQIIGSALFKNGIMIGTLSGEETRLALNLRSKSIAKYMRVTFPDPLDNKYRVAARLLKHGKTEIEVTTTEPLRINVNLPLDFEILSIPSGINYVTNLANQELLRKEIEEKLTGKFEKLVKRTQEEYKTNPFNWSHIARRQFLTMMEYEGYNWTDKYPDAEVTIQLDVRFSGFGKQLTPPKDTN